MQKPTKAIVEEWRLIYEKYQSLIYPNSKNATEVINYLRQKYPLKEENSQKLNEVVIDNIKMNQFEFKIPDFEMLVPIVYTVLNKDNAKVLYEIRQEVYKGTQIIVGVELKTGYFFVEGSDELADEVTAFKGLDKYDTNNFYLVANYIRCLNKFNMLEDYLNGRK